MNCNATTPASQAHRETFDPADEVLKVAWSRFLARYEYDCFATITFKNGRRDVFEVHNAFRMLLFRWQMTEALSRGMCEVKRKGRQDAYGRQLADRVTYKGKYSNGYKRGKFRAVYCLGVEPHRRGDLHAHAVIRFTTPFEMQRSVGWRIWTTDDLALSMNNGWSRIEPPKSQGDVLGYCSKYVTKGGEMFLSHSFNSKHAHAGSTRVLLPTE